MEHLAAGTKTSAIVAVVNKMDASEKVIAKYFTEMRGRLRRALNKSENKENKDPFICQMESRGYSVKVRSDDEGHITNLFFSNETTVENVKRCLEVFMGGATHTTNIFGYPLVNAIGVSNVLLSTTLRCQYVVRISLLFSLPHRNQFWERNWSHELSHCIVSGCR